MRKTAIHNGSCRGGFTLIELLVATSVMAIILAAVATLASAMGNADRETKNMSEQQSQIRYTTMRITELIRNASLIVPVSSPRIGFCVWTDSDEDGLPDGTELVYIEIDISLAHVKGMAMADGMMFIGDGNCSIEILEFPVQADVFRINEIANGSARDYCLKNGTSRFTTIIPESFNAEVFVDSDRKFASLKFSVSENGVDHQYQISGTRRCSADYVLNAAGELIFPRIDDDQ